MAVCAQISIPQPGGVPFTLQAWAVALTGLVLGPKKGAVAALVYVLLGAVGAPVFSPGTTVGLARIAGPTGGFILSFPVMAFLVGLMARKGRMRWMFPALLVGNGVNLTVGLLWFALVMDQNLPVAFGMAVAPFLVVTCVQIAVVPLVAKSILGALQRGGIDISHAKP